MGSCCSTSKAHKTVSTGAGAGRVGAGAPPSACVSVAPSLLCSPDHEGRDPKEQQQHRSGHRHAPEATISKGRPPLPASATESHDATAGAGGGCGASSTIIPVQHAATSLPTCIPGTVAARTTEERVSPFAETQRYSDENVSSSPHVHLDGIVLLEPVVTPGCSQFPDSQFSTDIGAYPQEQHRTLRAPRVVEDTSACDAAVAVSNPLTPGTRADGDKKREEHRHRSDPLAEPIVDAAVGERAAAEAVTGVTTVADPTAGEPLAAGDEDLFGSLPAAATVSTTDSRSVSCGSKSTDPSLVPTTFSSWSSAELAAAVDVPPLSPGCPAAAAGVGR